MIAFSLPLVALLIASPSISHAPHLDDMESGGFLDAVYALGLTALVLFLAAGLGSILIKPFKLDNWGFLERTVVSLPLGLAAIAYGEFFLGLAGWIAPIHQVLWLIVIAIVSVRPGAIFLIKLVHASIGIKTIWQAFSPIKKILFLTGGLALLLSFFQTLTPPYDYDGLMYHLQGPRLFLDAGRIYLNLDNWFTVYPSTWEMVYMLGMGLGSDIFARLIHFVTLLLLVFGTYAFGKRWLPDPGRWLAGANMLGMPVLLVWGTLAYIDLALGLLQFLAIAIFLIWTQEKQKKYLALSGIMQGIALGIKYTAAWGVIILVIGIIWVSIREKENIDRWKKFLLNLSVFGASAALVAAPMYIKNLIWTGNPVFPYYLPQNLIDPVEIQLVLDYLHSFGTGKHWFDYVLLPINIFIKLENFTAFGGNLDIPNPVFLLAMVYPFIRKRISDHNRKILDILAVITFFQFLIWTMGSQQTRFITPLTPGLSIIASSVILVILNNHNRIKLKRVLFVGAVGGMIVVSMATMANLVSLIQPHRVIMGVESKSQFLSRGIIDFRAIEFINQDLAADVKVLMPWNGKGYYCANKCLPDVGQAKWTKMTMQSSELADVKQYLQDLGVTHLLLSSSDFQFFVDLHDPLKVHFRANKYLREVFIPACTREVYSDESTRVYQIHYDQIKCR